jgi:hypothetical protein
MLEIEDLALVVIDPMASFVHADVNADPAAGAAFMGLLAQIATETGATVMVNHHMAKIRDKDPVTTPEEARNLIRGTSAIVDGVRSAFAVWQVDEGVARTRCKNLGVTYTRNAVFDGAVVKSNGVANRDIRHFIRNPNNGLLEDRSEDIRSIIGSEIVRNRLEYVFNFIDTQERAGIYMTHDGQDSVFETIASTPDTNINVANLRDDGKTTIKNAVTALLQAGRIGKYKRTNQGSRRFLGVVGGDLHQAQQEIINGGE